MIQYLKGTVVELQRGSCVLNVGQYGFSVVMHENDLKKIIEQQDYCIFTHLIWKEEGIHLYGFLESAHRKLFLELIKVESIGPKLAMKILSQISYEQLLQAIQESQLEVLSSVSGVGSKTAQRILLNLKGKIQIHEEDSMMNQKDHVFLAEILQALVDSGYDKKNSETVLKKIYQQQQWHSYSKEERDQYFLAKALEQLR